MRDDKKTWALIIGGIVILVAAMVFVFYRESKKTVSPVTNTNQTGQATDQTVSANEAEKVQAITQWLREGDGDTNSQTVVPPTPTPTPTPTKSPTPTGKNPTPTATPKPTPTPYLSVPGDPNFNAATFSVTSNNTPASVASYLVAINTALSGFDLVNSTDLDSRLSQVFSSGNFQDFSPMKDTIKQKQRALLSVPVPSRILGLAQDYFTSYSKLYNFLDLMQQAASSPSNQSLQIQAQQAGEDFSFSSDALGYSYDLAKQIAEQ